MPGQLQGKVAIVTGGGWNIGRATALRFAREGARVVVASRRAERLEEVAAAIRDEGGEALAVQTDVLSLASVEALAARTLERFGTIDVLVALAGGGGTDEAIDEIDPVWWDTVVRTNVVGTFHAVRAVLPTMRAKNAGTIVTCAGGGATNPVFGVRHTAYSCANAAVCRFTDQLAVELLDTHIRVNCLLPGSTWSPDTFALVEAEEARSGRPHPNRATNRPPEESAELALFLASDASAPMFGRTVATTEDWWRDPARVHAVSASDSLYCLRRIVL